jgi:hypothetical protein
VREFTPSESAAGISNQLCCIAGKTHESRKGEGKNHRLVRLSRKLEVPERQIFWRLRKISYRAKKNRATKRTQKVSEAITIPLKRVNECVGFVLTGVINEAMKPLFGSA